MQLGESAPWLNAPLRSSAERSQKKVIGLDFTLVTLQGTNISPKNGILKMIFLFPRWDMLISWRVYQFGCFFGSHKKVGSVAYNHSIGKDYKWYISGIYCQLGDSYEPTSLVECDTGFDNFSSCVLEEFFGALPCKRLLKEIVKKHPEHVRVEFQPQKTIQIIRVPIVFVKNLRMAKITSTESPRLQVEKRPWNDTSNCFFQTLPLILPELTLRP